MLTLIKYVLFIFCFMSMCHGFFAFTVEAWLFFSIDLFLMFATGYGAALIDEAQMSSRFCHKGCKHD